nr:hypothetical protein [Tanacetum cinerariifolium]
WDAKGFEYKHDYTIIDLPRIVVFPVSNNERKIMRFNEIYKFSDGTLTNIMKALDFRVREYKQDMDQQYPTVAKIPMLDTRKFEQWQFRMQQYLQYEHYALWEVIKFEDSYVVPANDSSTTTTNTTSGKKLGRTVTLTTEDMQRKKNDTFSRLQVIEGQLQFMGVEVEQDDLNQKTLEYYNEGKKECIESLRKELENLKKEKEVVAGKLAGLLTALKDLDNLIESQRSDKSKEGLGYTVVPPPTAQLYLSPKKDLS